MATVVVSSTLHSSYMVKTRTCTPSFSPSLAIPTVTLKFRTKLTLKRDNRKWGFGGMRGFRSGEEEGTLVTEREIRVQEQREDTVVASEEQLPVAGPVSPSDKLTMHFQADGTMNEASIPNVTNALEGTEGITDLRVKVLEGVATIELKKQTTVQATGVAAGLIETIQGSGFKLQTLNLSFEDEEEVLV